MKIALILGTRPEVLKLAPIIFNFKKHKVCCISIIDTQQQISIKEQALRDYQIEPSIRLQAPKSHDLNDKSSHIQFQLNRILKKLQVDSIIVQGDTLSAFVGAVCAFNLSIPIIHLEAGLRSHLPFSPYPEEAYRRMISCMTSLHLAPNQLAVNNLLSEGIQEKTIKLVGNPLTDLKPNHSDLKNNVDVIITIHRRENHQHISKFINIIQSCAQKHPDQHFVILKHSHPIVNSTIEQSLDIKIDNLESCNHLSHSTFINTLKKCKLILTDSGGIQEEAAFWNIPTLILRNVTDRPDGLNKQTHLVGTDSTKINTLINKYLTQNLNSKVKIEATGISKIITETIIEFIQTKQKKSS